MLCGHRKKYSSWLVGMLGFLLVIARSPLVGQCSALSSSLTSSVTSISSAPGALLCIAFSKINVLGENVPKKYSSTANMLHFVLLHLVFLSNNYPKELE